MKSIYIFILAIMALSVGSGTAAASHNVVLVTGDVMTVDRARVEDDRVWISWNGMTLSIDKKDVLRIEGDGERHIVVHDAPAKPRSPERQASTKGPGRTQKASQPNRPVDAPMTNRSKSTGAPGRQPQKPGSGRPGKSSPPDRPSGSAEKFMAFLTPEGFGDLKWGDRLDPRAGFRRLDEDSELPEVHEYFRKNDPLQQGQAGENRVVKYAFWRNRLYMVTLWDAGPEAYAAMREAMINRYGPGIKSPEKELTCYWIDETADRMIEYLKGDDLALLWMRSRRINHEYKLTQLRIPIKASQITRGESAAGRPQTEN